MKNKVSIDSQYFNQVEPKNKYNTVYPWSLSQRKKKPFHTHRPPLKKPEENYYISKKQKLKELELENGNVKSSEILIDTRKQDQGIRRLNTFGQNSYYIQQVKKQKYKTYRVGKEPETPQPPEKIQSRNFDFENECADQGFLPLLTQPQFRPYKTASNTIYTVLMKKKNEFMNSLSQKEYDMDFNYNPIETQRCFRKNPPNNTFVSRRSNNLTTSESMNCPMLSQMNFSSFSQKNRYVKIMDEFYKLKAYIDKTPEKMYEIMKEFLMNHGVYDLKYYAQEKLDNFDHYLHSDFRINPSLSLKENIFASLDYDKNKKANASTETAEERKAQRYPDYEKEKPEEPISELVTNMELQKSLYDKKSLLQEHIDIINKPEVVINLLKDEFSTDEDKGAKVVSTESSERKGKFKNERLYGAKKSSVDYEVLKKENKLTEYICLVKAKNYLEMNKIKKSVVPKGIGFKPAIK